MAEWSKAHAWKVCIRQRIEGSNPSFSAIFKFKQFSSRLVAPLVQSKEGLKDKGVLVLWVLAMGGTIYIVGPENIKIEFLKDD